MLCEVGAVMSRFSTQCKWMPIWRTKKGFLQDIDGWYIPSLNQLKPWWWSRTIHVWENSSWQIQVLTFVQLSVLGYSAFSSWATENFHSTNRHGSSCIFLFWVRDFLSNLKAVAPINLTSPLFFFSLFKVHTFRYVQQGFSFKRIKFTTIFR